MQVTEYLPPDISAAFKILRAYDPAFREKTEVTNSFSRSDLVALSMKDREERAKLAAEGKVIEAIPVRPKAD